MPPEAEENGAHAQGREANCSLQRKLRCSTKQRMRVNVDCGRQTYCVIYGTQGGKKKKKRQEKKSDFQYSETKFIIRKFVF